MQDYSDDELKKINDDYQEMSDKVNAIPTKSNLNFQELLDKYSQLSPSFLGTQKQPDQDLEQPMPKQEVSLPQAQPLPQSNTFTDKELQDAINSRNKNQLISNLGRASEQIGAAIARRPMDASFYDHLDKQSEQGVSDVKLKRAQQEVLMNNAIKRDQADPNSELSQKGRDFAKKMGVNVGPNTSYASLKPLLEEAQKYQQFKENSEMRKELANIKKSEMQSARDAKTDAKDTQRFDQMSKLVESNVGSSRSAFGKAALNLQSITAAEALLSGSTNLDDIDSREISEVARVLDRILSQGTPTVSGTQKLTPETARSIAASLIEKATSERQGAGLGEFVKRYQKTLQREKDVAKKQVADTQQSLLSSYVDLKNKNPEKYNHVLKMHNIPSEEELKQKKEEASAQSSEDEAAISWAKKNMPDPRAQQILKLHGIQ